MDRIGTGQAPARRNSAQIADKLGRSHASSVRPESRGSPPIVRRASLATPGLGGSRTRLRGSTAVALAIAGSTCATRLLRRRGDACRGTGLRRMRTSTRWKARRSGPQRNAPSRLRLRPAFRLTAAEATADRRAINLGRSVLGASQDTRGRRTGRQGAREAKLSQIAIFSFRTGSTLRIVRMCSSCLRGRKRAGHEGPAAKSSPSRERFRPPSRRTFRFRVVLLGGLRPTGAPCSAQAETYDTGRVRSRGSGERNFAQFAARSSADPALAVPVRAEPAAPVELEVELVGLDEARRREDLEPVGRVHELERRGRAARSRSRARNVRPRQQPRAPRPDVDGATVRRRCARGAARFARTSLTGTKFRVLAMRDRARAVVIGGGVGGCSILYWLARLGWDDVVLVERAELTSGSTFHSAGLVGQLRSSLVADEDDDGERRPLPLARGRGRPRDRAGARSARSGSRRRPSGWRRSRARPAGRRRSASRSS